jgi:3-hydroxyacyl-CoA dehydrogenase
VSAPIGIVGTGLIGRSWAIVFARAGRDVALYDSDPAQIESALRLVEGSLRDLEAQGLIGSAADVRARMRPAASLADALDGVDYVQESVFEDRALKAAVFADMDAIAAPGTILGSSCSAIPGSQFLDLPGRARCLIAHPVSPPYLVPLVELVPTPWTAPEIVEATRRLMDDVGQTSILVHKEIGGFVLNRLQAAVINEAMYLIGEGVVTPDDLDKTMRDGLGLRWSFMGPFETMDLNSDRGFEGYTGQYGGSLQNMGADLKVDRPWRDEALAEVEADRRARVPAEDIAERQAWRDRRLMALLRHKARAADEIGS